jgi:hypothetical protein
MSGTRTAQSSNSGHHDLPTLVVFDSSAPAGLKADTADRVWAEQWADDRQYGARSGCAPFRERSSCTGFAMARPRFEPGTPRFSGGPLPATHLQAAHPWLRDKTSAQPPLSWHGAQPLESLARAVDLRYSRRRGAHQQPRRACIARRRHLPQALSRQPIRGGRTTHRVPALSLDHLPPTTPLNVRLPKPWRPLSGNSPIKVYGRTREVIRSYTRFIAIL